MPVRTDEEVREALEAQADDNANAGELLDILRWSSSGNAAQKRARLLSFLDGPASRRRAGWLDLLLQVHAAGATSFNDVRLLTGRLSIGTVRTPKCAADAAHPAQASSVRAARAGVTPQTNREKSNP
jgi:hypothetical protein